MKKIIFILLLIFELFCITSIYLIGGQLGAYVWVGCIFIISPIAAIALIAQIIILLIRLFKKKKSIWNVIFVSLTIIMAYPVTVLFGASLLTYPTHVDMDQAVNVIKPVDNAILLGGKSYKAHAVWPSECYAYDILKEPYDINSNNLNDYGIFLSDVYCPVSGTVIGLYDSEEDIMPNIEEFTSLLGNYLFIEIDDTKTYLILGHLEKDSINVSVGDHINQGEIIAKVGNSGTTSEPHLHIQHQRNNPLNTKISICAEGLPMRFVEND